MPSSFFIVSNNPKASLSEGGGRGDIRFTEIDEVGGSLPLT